MSDIQNDGGPAFPVDRRPDQGMSLRDWFAGMALQGLLSNPHVSGDVVICGEKIPYDRAAYMFADAMLKVRKM